LPRLASGGSITLLGAVTAYFGQAAQGLPASRVATTEDIAEVVAMAATNPNLTGTVIEPTAAPAWCP